MDSKKPAMKCSKCGSTNLEKKASGDLVCKDCWTIQKTSTKHIYTYPLDPYPVGKK